jgi:predicted AlkP superfamily phosphohydrolase/phosphomutase
MRDKIFKIIKQYKHEITEKVDLFDDEEVEDWFYYAEDFVLNVHDYDQDGVIDIQAYAYDVEDNTDWGTMLFNEQITLEEFNKL